MADRIVHLVPTLQVGGGEWFVVQLAEAQLARGADVHVVCLTGGGPLLDRASDALRPRIHVVGKRFRYDASVLLGVARWLRRLRPEVVHAHLFTGLSWGLVASRLAGVGPFVFTEHGCHDEKYRVSAFLYRRLVPRVDAVVACSEEARRALVGRGMDPERVLVVENGITLAGRPRASLDGDPIVVGCVGRMAHIKGQRFLVDAVARLRDRGCDVRLDLVGDGPLRADLEARVADLDLGDRVRFTGNVDDVPERLAGMDLFVLPSLSEALPLAALEAGAAGLPLLVTSGGGVRLLIEEQGAGGWVVPPGDPDALADRIAAYAALPVGERRALGQQNVDLVTGRYSLSAAVDRYAQVYADAR